MDNSNLMKAMNKKLTFLDTLIFLSFDINIMQEYLHLSIYI